MTYEKKLGKIQCNLCPHGCELADGGTGICRVRQNRRGELSLPYYGMLSALAMDPIEKKPLYHFHPGSRILSAGFYGCNFRCPFCQNYNISQQLAEGGSVTTPEELVQAAVRQGSVGIAYTYSEPLVHFEYILKSAKLARENGLKNVLVTNGYINPTPAAELLEWIDAANVDLKSFNGDFYQDEIRGTLDPVLAFIKQAAGVVSLEVTTLVIPGKNDSTSEIRAISGFISDISAEIPLHLSCYYPTYKYTVKATTPDTVFDLARTAREKLKYVYEGNVGRHETNTFCPNCGTLLVKRRGYSVTIESLSNGRCSDCGTKIPVVTS